MQAPAHCARRVRTNSYRHRAGADPSVLSWSDYPRGLENHGRHGRVLGEVSPRSSWLAVGQPQVNEIQPPLLLPPRCLSSPYDWEADLPVTPRIDARKILPLPRSTMHRLLHRPFSNLHCLAPPRSVFPPGTLSHQELALDPVVPWAFKDQMISCFFCDSVGARGGVDLRDVVEPLVLWSVLQGDDLKNNKDTNTRMMGEHIHPGLMRR